MKARFALVCAVIISIASLPVMAHQETFKGRVVGVDKATVTVTVVNPKTKKASVMTFKAGTATKVLRGDAVVQWTDAKIQAKENIAVTVDHDEDEELAVVIRLDAAKK